MEENKAAETQPQKSKNMMLIVGIVVVALVAAGGFLLLGSKGANTPTTSPAETATEQEASSPTSATGEAVETVSIETKNFAFSPTTIRVKAGGKISFTNRDTVAHSFTADDGKSFDSGLVGKDKTVTVTAPTEPGEYPLHCTPHPFMKGTLIVEAQ
ncbi:cupredoxin domain-containing protein [Candidatus Woesebacteria bacterium]|nr:cupredoxin domain-containing protein [Candidatus Woesebacteria bacterium]